MLRYFLLLALLFPSLSCVNTGTVAQRSARARSLAADLRALGPKVSAVEAERTAEAAIERAAEMKEFYDPLALPWLNNALINVGVGKGGLCYHWRNGIYRALEELELKTLDLHFACARQGTVKEHNSVVVTAHGAPFTSGLVLDGWRHGGVLWWGLLTKDKYPWLEVPVSLERKSYGNADPFTSCGESSLTTGMSSFSVELRKKISFDIHA